MPLIQLVEVLIVGGSPLAGQSVHPDGWVSQVDSECSGGHRSDGVGPEGRWAVGFPRRDPRRLIGLCAVRFGTRVLRGSRPYSIWSRLDRVPR